LQEKNESVDTLQTKTFVDSQRPGLHISTFLRQEPIL
jgi:hypothetical protein